MQFHEFEKHILPLALKIGYMPEVLPLDIKDEFLVDLFQSCENPAHSWEAQSYMFDRWAILNLDFKYLVESVILLIKSYEYMNELKSQGVSKVKIICYKALPSCPNNKIEPLQELIDGFHSCGSTGFVVPRLDCPRNFVDGGGLCNCRVIPAFDLPDSMSWAKEIFESIPKKP